MSAAISVLIAEDDEGHATLMQRNLRRGGLLAELVHGAFGDMVRRLAEFLMIVEMPLETPLDRPPHAR